MASEFALAMAGAAAAHQAAAASREGNGQQTAGRTRRTSADPQRAQQGATAAAAAAPTALDSLSRMQQLANASPQVAQLRRLQALADARFAPMAQLAGGPEEGELVQGKFATAELQPQLQQAPRANNTGLPDQLKSGIESLSGLSLDHVRVHYNSSQPAQLNALAYAQGSDIHVAPGQEKHLAHEAWHVVQQKQGRVKPTMQMKGGVEVNDDAGLEREADVMGAKAVQMKKTTIHSTESQTGEEDHGSQYSEGKLIQNKSGSDVTQLVLATVNPQNGPVFLEQVVAPAPLLDHVIMQNIGQPDGEDVNNEVGFAGVLNEAEWAGLGKSPNNFWRAHGYAKSFGGAGNGRNVGWWSEVSEREWTKAEQKVRGAGQEPVEGWKPAIGEQGTYHVEREMHPQVLFKERYVEDLMKGINWGMDPSRDAWNRALLATCNKIQNPKEKEKRIAQLNVARGNVIVDAQRHIQNWVNNLFGTITPLETNLIQSMKMDYKITKHGDDATMGPARRDMSWRQSSGMPKPFQFGLENQPEEIWIKLVNHNTGIFSKAFPPIDLLTERVAYPDNPHRPAQELRAYQDGWGVE